MSLWKHIQAIFDPPARRQSRQDPPPRDPRPSRDTGDAISALTARVAHLEEQVARLRQERNQGESGAPSPSPPSGGDVERPMAPRRDPDPGLPQEPEQLRTAERDVVRSRQEQPAAPARSGTDWVQFAEDWVGKVGAALLFIGLAFLYRYAVDYGWITPLLRVGFGAVLGAALLGLGLRWRGQRPRYGQLLLGAGIAVLYLTWWAAHVLYDLIPWAAGFGLMLAVTVLALLLADRHRQELLAVLGVAGGFATPFILDSPAAGVAALTAYAVLVLGASGFLQFRHGWRSLLVLNGAAGFAIMVLASESAAGFERWAVQAGVLVAWVVVGVVPFIRDARAAGTAGVRGHGPAALWLASLAGSAAAAGVTARLWDLADAGGGLVLVALAVAYLTGSRLLPSFAAVWRAAVGTGTILLLIGSTLAVGPPWYPLVVALEVSGIMLLARRDTSTAFYRIGHLAFGLLALVYLEMLAAAVAGGPAGFGARSSAMLGVILLAAGSAVSALVVLAERRLYLVGSYVAGIAWLAWVLTPLPGGHGLTSAAWGLTALVVLAAGMRRDDVWLRMTGLATLGAVAAKLLLVDLSALDAGLRILLFLGVGGGFLALGYVLKGKEVDDGGTPAADEHT